ncbi:hypothetical protein [Nioella nitratireducens]|uniref:hypothetical protein n=1 Tax=Nioella nitratireducens TaxID=1287720 RepID=UPI0008FCE671|nr:hypothetical protein [Nioella nitratireducens]
MASLQFVALLQRQVPEFLTAISDLDLRQSASGDWVLYATSRSGSEVSVFAVAANGSASLRDSQTVAGDTDSLAFLTMGATDYALGLSPQAAMSRLYALDASGNMTGPPRTLPQNANANAMDGLVQIGIGGNSYLYYTNIESPGLEAFRIEPSGSLSAVALGTAAQPISGLAQAKSGSTDYLLTANAAGTQLQSYQVLADGSLVERGSCGAEQGLGVAGISAFDHVTAADGTYVVVAARDSSSLSVLRMNEDGSLSPSDHIIDDLTTRFQHVTAIDTVTLGDRIFVLAGGADDGLSMFELLPGGRLLHHSTMPDGFGSTLANVSAIGATVQNGQLQIFVGSATETGISQMSAAPGTTGPTRFGGAGNDTIQGGDTGDVIFGGAGNDRLVGNGGDDVLMDGAGRDTLFGGAGTDIFVMEADGARDEIRDFTANEDRLDLTGWPMLRNLQQISFQELQNGATITYGDEELRLYSDNGLPLSWDDVMDSTPLGLTRVPAVPPEAGTPEITFTGGPGADLLDGNVYDNIMAGLAGRDTIRGADGNDTIDGGDGNDYLEGNRGDDHLDGSSGDDTLIGGERDDVLNGGTGGDLLIGDSGNDKINGNNGNDTLDGGVGDDLLNGGVGADVLIGGSGQDTVSYEGSYGSLRVDLWFPQINTNIAAGDTYEGVEHLIGSRGFDNLRGTIGDNHIQGMANVDYIFGRRGADTLEGGVGDDVLFGGVGGDHLDGGSHRDRAQYSESQTAILADLADPSRNTGEAAGDVYVSIEDLAGGAYDDVLFGDQASNRLFGRENDDQLFGRQGNDYLNGGGGADTLDGGLGDDTLRGGATSDTFVFNGGHDVIEDFYYDHIQIDSSIWAGTVHEMLALAVQQGNDMVFDLGNGNSLTLNTFSDTTLLDTLNSIQII